MGTKGGIKIQRGFIAGVAAVAIVSLATGLMLRYSSISASTQWGRYSWQDRCQTEGIRQTELEVSEPTTEERERFGVGVRAYNIGINGGYGKFRFVISATRHRRLFAGDSVDFHLGLTFKERRGGNNRDPWGGYNDRVYLLFNDGSRLDYVYNIARPNQLMEKTLNKTLSRTDNVLFNVEFQGKNYDGCIHAISLRELLDSSNATPSPTVSSSPTTTPSPTVSETADAKQFSIILRPGFNGYLLNSNRKVLDTQKLKNAGMTVWAFNRHGDESWHTTGFSVDKIVHGIGYYIYNPTSELKKVGVDYSADQSEPLPPYVTKGWNLLANGQKDTSVALKDIEVMLNPCPPNENGIASCKTVGTKVKLSDLFIGNPRTTQKAYPIIFIVDDVYATDAKVAFKKLKITSENRETATIPASKMFWVYVWPDTINSK